MDYSFKFKINENYDYSILNGRDVFYFDINIWIDLADQKTKQLKNAQEILRSLVKNRKIFCPLHFPVLSELYKMSLDSMKRVGKLMTEFSLNFSFSRSEIIWIQEIHNFIYSYLHQKNYKVKNDIKFVPYIGYLSPNASLIFPDDYNNKVVQEMFSLLKGKISNTTLMNMIELSDGFKNRKIQDYSSKIQNSWKKIWNQCKGDKRRIRIENENFIAQNKLLPIIKKINSTLTPDQLLSVTNYISSFPKDKQRRAFNSIIQKIPSLRNEVEIFSIVPLDNQRKVSMNDFFDLENIIVPLAYSDVFISKDKWIRHLLKISDLPQKNNCIYLYNVNQLVDYISEKYLKIGKR